MTAPALPAPGSAADRLPVASPLLRLRSDEQLLAAFRSGSDAAFTALHDRYRQRLFAYVRRMLSAGSRQDAEDVLQDVFVRAYGTLRADGREMNVRAWLYRVAHNRCIDHLRRPSPPVADLADVSRRPLHDPLEEAQRREDLARLVHDIARLPEQQRSALLMREIDGLSYQELAGALDVTVPAIKSLLVRARVGLVEAAQARDADCHEIRGALLDAYDRGVKASGHARRHLRTCEACTEYRAALRGMRRSFAALTPVGFGPLALAAKVFGLSGAGGGAAAGGTAAAGGGALAGGSALAGATVCKVAVVVCSAAIAGGALEVHHARHAHHVAAPATAPQPAAEHGASQRRAPVRAAAASVRTPAVAAPAAPAPTAQAAAAATAADTAVEPPADTATDPAAGDPVATADPTPDAPAGTGTATPAPSPAPTATPAPTGAAASGASPTPAPTAVPAATPAATPAR